jgi:hypothetical protein
VLAIPALDGVYHLALVIARNRFGTALGPLRGGTAFPRLDGSERYQAGSRPIYTDEQLIADGAWPIVGHADDLLSLFPGEPELYHAPDLLWSGRQQIGEFAAAESPTGAMRQLDRREAERVGVLIAASDRRISTSRCRSCWTVEETEPGDRGGSRLGAASRVERL